MLRTKVLQKERPKIISGKRGISAAPPTNLYKDLTKKLLEKLPKREYKEKQRKTIPKQIYIHHKES